LKKVNRIEGEWLLEEEGPQFRAKVKTEKGEYSLEADQPSFRRKRNGAWPYDILPLRRDIMLRNNLHLSPLRKAWS